MNPAPLSLPPALEEWRQWLSLFPPELGLSMGQLLLRLHPLVGKLKAAATPNRDALTGVGNIVRRGSYDRLLMTEWLFADAEPDEFLRRAASNELLFLGPEPDIRLRSQLCLALFDAGPLQLGECRLAHMALFIILTRRAHEAGAEFKWGILQQPGVLHDSNGKEGIQKLLAAKTLVSPTESHLQAWNKAIDDITVNCDCWQISSPAPGSVKKATALVSINVDLLKNSLRLQMSAASNRKDIELELPEAGHSVRLLREPFRRFDLLGHIADADARPSDKHSPRLSPGGGWVAIAQQDKRLKIYHVPNSPRAAPGKPRTVNIPTLGQIISFDLFGKNPAYFILNEEDLFFVGFPKQYFYQERVSISLPDPTSFKPPTDADRMLTSYFLPGKVAGTNRSRVLAVDTEQRLVCWTFGNTKSWNPVSGDSTTPEFSVLAEKVLGTEYLDKKFIFGTSTETGILIHRWYAHEETPVLMEKLAYSGTRLLFGDQSSWNNKKAGLLALQLSYTEWLISREGSNHKIEVVDAAQVVGVVRYHETEQAEYGLVVLHKDRKTIFFKSLRGLHVLHKSPQPILHISMDALCGKLAWVVEATLELHVCSLYEQRPLLRVSAEKVHHAQ
ncbi:hypothetical protein [Undibacterium sp. Ji49W]|uniref:hypothetical protein n=1 Tax=Undibacterium sp. Ji49W TaxID=3413040 RepID=UPI003BF138B6